ncbi:PDDEXK nuclease domain-containing protein [Flavobacterium sp. RHBU_24]|uniref:PDDEXK nuclease domain-containing protein n=1 Tax=Flavobacterium sp. RHBU_24 TaxID=3391185 RepID=UPI003984F986
MEHQFVEIISIIKNAQATALRAVNAELINLYWNIGCYISERLKNAEWGEKTVNELASYIQQHNPELKGFSRTGMYRMIQFFETYRESSFTKHVLIQNTDNQNPIIVPSLMGQFQMQDIRKTSLVQISWTHHSIIVSRCKSSEERSFYITISLKEHYSVRELERQISAGLFERTMLGQKNEALKPSAERSGTAGIFKDSYVFDFLNLPEVHSENDLQKGLTGRMKDFILEIGKDFIFMGEEYKLQVGSSDFFIDLLFYHRGLQCLVAFELKADKFRPEHIGQLNFYLEALDRDIKKEHENPSIGILLCKDKDMQVVEYALSRSLSPTMVAEYRTQLPDKTVLQDKLNDFFVDDFR